MTLNDLKVGDKIKIRDGSEYFIKDQEDLNHEIQCHNEELLHCFGDYRNGRYDIMKVERYVPYYANKVNKYIKNSLSYETINFGGLKTVFLLETIYERKEEILTEEEKETNVLNKLSYQQLGVYLLERHDFTEYNNQINKQISQIGGKINEIIDYLKEVKKQ